MQPISAEHGYKRFISTFARARSCYYFRDHTFYIYDLYAAARLQLLCYQHQHFATNWQGILSSLAEFTGSVLPTEIRVFPKCLGRPSSTASTVCTSFSIIFTRCKFQLIILSVTYLTTVINLKFITLIYG